MAVVLSSGRDLQNSPGVTPNLLPEGCLGVHRQRASQAALHPHGQSHSQHVGLQPQAIQLFLVMRSYK